MREGPLIGIVKTGLRTHAFLAEKVEAKPFRLEVLTNLQYYQGDVDVDGYVFTQKDVFPTAHLNRGRTEIVLPSGIFVKGKDPFLLYAASRKMYRSILKRTPELPANTELDRIMLAAYDLGYGRREINSRLLKEPEYQHPLTKP